MLLLIFALITGAQGLSCVAKGPCGCELDDNSGYIDLSPLMKQGSPMFMNVQMQGGIFSFTVDLCQKFKCVSDGDAFICATSALQQTLITATTLKGYDVSPDRAITFIYTNTSEGETISTRITMHCSQDTGKGSLSTFESADQKLFTTTLTSQYACLQGGSSGGGGNKKKGLSTGSVMCIILLVLVIVYVVGGILINKYVRKVEEGSLVPNVEFWKALPGFIKDGCQFSFSKLKRSKEYEQI